MKHLQIILRVPGLLVEVQHTFTARMPLFMGCSVLVQRRSHLRVVVLVLVDGRSTRSIRSVKLVVPSLFPSASGSIDYTAVSSTLFVYTGTVPCTWNMKGIAPSSGFRDRSRYFFRFPLEAGIR